MSGYVGINTQLYTPVDYIESSGTQYIDTGVLPYQTEVELQFQYTALTSTTYLCGCYNDNNNRYGLIANRTADNDIAYGDRNNVYYTLGTADTQTHTIIYNGTNNQVVYDNVTKGTISDLTTTASRTFTLFAYNVTTGAANFAQARIYYCKITDKSTNTLIRDFIPVLDQNNVACLYDKVEGKLYYNQSSGTFAYGTANTPVTKDVARTLSFGSVGVNGTKYTPVDYIESSGTQYVDTGFKPNNNTKVECQVYYYGNTSSSSGFFFYGARDSGAVAQFGCYVDATSSVNKAEPRYGTQNGTRANLAHASTHNILQDKNVFTLDSTTTVTMTSQTFQTNYNMYIFGMNTGGGVGSVALSGNRVYSFKIYDNATLVRDFIPVIDYNNVACLFDKVENKFYYNQGTGSFTYGTAGAPVERRCGKNVNKRICGC